MTDLGQYLYQGSLSDIRFNVENIEYIRQLKIKFEYSQMGMLFTDVLNLLLNEQKLLVEAHKLRYCEKVDVKTIQDNLRNAGLRKSKAIEMIGQIERAGIVLRERERVFIDGLKGNGYKTLTPKQTEWLNRIYAEVVG